MSDLTLPCALPIVGNLVEGWTGPVLTDNWPAEYHATTLTLRDEIHPDAIPLYGYSPARQRPQPNIVFHPPRMVRLDCTRPEVQWLLLHHHRRLGQPIDSWFWSAPEKDQAALIRWSALRMAAGMGAAMGWATPHPRRLCWDTSDKCIDARVGHGGFYGWSVTTPQDFVNGPETDSEGFACARAAAHRLGIWVPGYSENQPDLEAP